MVAESRALNIRPATLDDVDGIQDVGLFTWPGTYAPLVSSAYVIENLSKWWSTKAVRRSITDEQVLVLTLEGKVVGVSVLGKHDDVPTIWKLYLLPRLHGYGLGTRLLRETCALAAGSAVQIEFLEGNESARICYERFGFVHMRTDRNTEGPGTCWYIRPSSG